MSVILCSAKYYTGFQKLMEGLAVPPSLPEMKTAKLTKILKIHQFFSTRLQGCNNQPDVFVIILVW